MLKDIKRFFEEKLLLDGKNDSELAKGIEYATAALMIELAKADFQEDDIERQLIIAMLRDTFDIEGDDLEQLMKTAEAGSADASDLFQFTSLINDHYDGKQKIELLKNLWRVAYADGRLDKYEEQFIRRIAGLIHLPPSEFTKTKLRIKHQLTQ
ncbi:MAG: putative tellurite resistance protein B-like protein [Patiriisocius sp.]|jgi:uncharacterized tellurite resistance protein B-like protein